MSKCLKRPNTIRIHSFIFFSINLSSVPGVIFIVQIDRYYMSTSDFCLLSKDFFLLNTLLLLWCRIVVDDLTVMTLISDPRVKLKYQHLITNSFVQCNRLLRWCPSPDCSNAIKVRTFLVVSNSYSLHPDPAKNPDPSCF